MTKEYNDSLIRGFVGFILKTIATTLLVLAILVLTGIVKVQFRNTEHNKQTFVDGVLVEDTTWNETENIYAGIDLHINVENGAVIWSK